MDLGDPISYLVLAPGTPVSDAVGEPVGEVDRVMAVAEDDIFEGLIVRHGHSRRFVPADSVGPMHEHGVALRITAAEVQALGEPSANPAVMSTGPDDTVADRRGLGATARRAWDRLSGRS